MQVAQRGVTGIGDEPAHELRNPRMAHPSVGGDPLPIAAPRLKQGSDFCIKVGTHAPIIAKFCDMGKQHFASYVQDTLGMGSKSINVVVAEALRFYMGGAWSNVSLAKKSGVAESTIRNYLSPAKREAGKSGKEPSAKVTELAQIADALGIQVSDLVTDLTDEERQRRRTHTQAAPPEWPFEALAIERFAALSERQKGRVEQALMDATAAIEAESRKRDGTGG